MSILLNARAWDLVEQMLSFAREYRVEIHELSCGAKVLDFGVSAEGSIKAGIRLAQVCTSGLMEIRIEHHRLGEMSWPFVAVSTDHAVESCLYSQYAGWKVHLGKFFAMGSGPMRATAASEELFSKLGYKETFYCSVGVLESRQLPDSEIVRHIAQQAHVEPRNLMLLVAPTSSIAGNVQIVARSIETCLHKMYELGFDVRRIVSGWGCAPLPPIAADDMTGIGRTNDAILYGGQVNLLIKGDDAELSALVKKIPSSASPMYGKPFRTIFEDAGRDFYKIDPMLFSPASVVIQNMTSGRIHHAGKVNHDVLLRSFEMA